MSRFKKNVIPHQKFYIAAFENINNKNSPYLIFIHGGPGLNCGVVEALMEDEGYFSSLNWNIILYDQRGCGRSTAFFEQVESVSHSDNINDLEEIYNYLTVNTGLEVK